MTNEQFEALSEAARAAQKKAYAPYSGFQIGAALLLENGAVVSGCNVENASFGGTICAERGAVLSAIAQFGAQKIAAVVVVSPGTPPWPPCGLCRQVLAEFCLPDCEIIAVNDQNERLQWRFGELFPSSFTPEHLK